MFPGEKIGRGPLRIPHYQTLQIHKQEDFTHPFLTSHTLYITLETIDIYRTTIRTQQEIIFDDSASE